MQHTGAARSLDDDAMHQMTSTVHNSRL